MASANPFPSSGTDEVPLRDAQVLVTGAAGFIGSHLCERLLEQGCGVWGLDNFDPEYAPEQKRRNLREALENPLMHMVEGDLRDSVLVNGLLRDQTFDAVVHLAAHRGSFPSRDDPRTCFDVNLMGTLELLEAMHRNHVPRLVFTSDLAGTARERSEGPGTPDDGDRPDSSRGMLPAAKRSAELLSHVYHRSHRLSAHVLRLGHVYGPREAPDLPVHRLALTLKGPGDPDSAGDRGEPAPTSDQIPPLSLLFVDDAVRGILASLGRLLQIGEDGAPSFEVYDLYTDRLVTPGDLRSRLLSVLGPTDGEDSAAPTSGGGRRTDGGDDAAAGAPETGDGRSPAWDALGVHPSVSLEEGLARLVEWLQTSGGREEMREVHGPMSLEGTGRTDTGPAAGIRNAGSPGNPGSL